MVGVCEQLIIAAPCATPASRAVAPQMVIHVPVVPAQTVSWRLAADAELQVTEALVWVTRLFSPYDYWLQPGDVLRLTRGERIWVTTDAQGGARITLTSAYVPTRRIR
jgi:hypothetical protein